MILMIMLLFLMNFLDKHNIFNNFFFNNNYQLNIESTIEKKSQLFLIILMFIVLTIYLFKKYYMDKEKQKKFFNFLFYWFVISMIIIIYCQNWLLMILGWDMLGVSSYLLIIFYNNSPSQNSGFVTMNTNRLGDVFLISFVSIAMNKNLINFNEKKYIILMSLILCLLTKSAQFPFSSWLPLAMAAPTPVSSLVHSSTLVTAGLYIFYKNDFLINNYSIKYILILSLFTSIYSGLMATMEMDMKKMIALSTLSQLSFMFISFSLGMIFLSFLHLLTHAIFKASLFFWAGMNMHSLKSEQVFLTFSQKSNKISQSFLFMIMLSLIGFPFSLGFFSKDQMIDMQFKNVNMMMNLTLIFTIYLTLIYTIRFMKKMTSMNYNKKIYKSIYFNLKNTTKSVFIFSLLMLMNSYMNNHWFKSSFLMISKGWKSFFLIVMIFMLSFYWMMTINMNKMMVAKMIFLNLFAMKINTMKLIKKNLKNMYFDFGWLNLLSKKSIIIFLDFSNFLILNLKKSMSMMLIFIFLMMNFVM